MPSFSNGRMSVGMFRKTAPKPPLLHEHVDTETGDVSQFKGKVTFSLFFEVLPLSIIHHVVDEGVCFIGGERRMVEFFEIALHPNHRRFAGTDMAVGGAFFDREGQQLGNIHRP